MVAIDLAKGAVQRLAEATIPGPPRDPRETAEPAHICIRSHTVIAVMLWSIFILTLLSAAGQVLRLYFGYPYVFGLVDWLNLNNEANPPTWYQTVALLLAALASAAVAACEKARPGRYWAHWAGIAVILVYMSADEGGKIHEATIPIIYRLTHITSGAFEGQWEFYGLALILLVGAVYFRFYFFHLSARERLITLAAAVVYLGGAVGMEMLLAGIIFAHGFIPHHRPTAIDAVMTHIEEVMEMLGVVIFMTVPLRRLERSAGLRIEFRRS